MSVESQKLSAILFSQDLPEDKDIPFITEIKSSNSFHKFELSLQIAKKSLFEEKLRPIELFGTSVDYVLSLSLRLLTKNKSFYNSNNELLEVNESYLEIYTIAELKNNIKGFEFFTELIDFKKALIAGIKKNEFELLIIKNMVLLNVNITNYFNITKPFSIIARPFLNKKSPKDIVKNILDKNKCIYSEISCINNFDKKNGKNILDVKEKENVSENNSSLIKKRLRNKEIIQRINKQDISNDLIENKKFSNVNINISIDETKIELPEFQMDSLAQESKIIEKMEQEILIGDAISNSPDKKYRLIYRASRDGDSANKFHYLCDKYSNLIILIETQKGLKFGGYTSSKFRSSSHLKFDNNAFLFSLDQMKVFNILPGHYAIYCYDNTGPCFSKGSLYVPNSFFSKYGKTRIAGGPFQFRKDYELNNGKEKFLIKELEVFQVKINDNIC